MPSNVDGWDEYLATLNPGTRALMERLNTPPEPTPQPRRAEVAEVAIANDPSLVLDLTVPGLLSIVDAVVRREFPAPERMDEAEAAAYTATTKYYGVIRIAGLAKTSIIAFRTRVWEVMSNGEWASVVEFTYDPEGNIVSQGSMFGSFEEWYADVCEQADLSNTYRSALWTNLNLVLPFAENPSDVLNLTERNFELLAVQANGLKSDLLDGSPEAAQLLNRKIQQAATMTSEALREAWGRLTAPTFVKSRALQTTLPDGRTVTVIFSGTDDAARQVETRIAPIVNLQHVTDLTPIESAITGEDGYNDGQPVPEA